MRLDSPPKALQLLLVEDHDLVRAGIRALVESLAGITVVGETGDGTAVLDLVAQRRPDLVLMDIALSGKNGLAVTAQVTAQFPAVKVLILSMHVNEEYVWQALRAGALGYILKNASIGELEQAIRTVAGGEAYLSPPVSRHLATDYMRRARGEPSSFERLTDRQRQILQQIAEGRTTQQMAAALGVSAKTVESHRAQLMERLEIHDVAGLVRYAIHLGLVLADA
jgi:DNA-binding NarL/FixJ family response regulator